MLVDVGALVDLRREMELILRCARTGAAGDSANAARIREVAAGQLNWEAAGELAVAQGVAPLVWAAWQALCAAEVPPEAARRLGAELTSNTRFSLYLTRALIQSLNLLEGHGIPAIPYKGPVLASQVYGRPSLRQFADLDVLVRRADALAARGHLLAAGFEQTWPAAELTPARTRRHLATKYNFTFMHTETKVVLELHWSLTPSYLGFPPDPEALWKGLGAFNLGGREVPVLSAEWLLLSLCVHGSNHCWLRLSNVADVAEAIAAIKFDAASLAKLAQRTGAARMLHLGLALAHDLLGASMPPALAAAVASDGPAQRLAARVAHRFRNDPNHWLGPFEEPRFHLAMRERWRDWARYCLGMAEPSAADWNAVRLPEALSFLYYVVRPVRLLAAHGLSLRQKTPA